MYFNQEMDFNQSRWRNFYNFRLRHVFILRSDLFCTNYN
jgi:hypothetical protein